MNRILKVSILSLGLLFTSSCRVDNFYDPGVIYEEEALLSSADLQLLLNSTYNIMGSRGESEFVSILTDEVGIGYANGGQGLNDEYVFFMNSGSGLPSTIWGDSYLGIARVNRILDGIEKITPKDAADARTIDNIKAQALTLRAYGHLRVLAYFTTDMTDDSALAGLIADRMYGIDENDFPRRTNGDVYAFIHKDLDDAISLFNSSLLPANDPNRANVNFARGLKARAYSYKEDYVNAELYANQVISTSNVALANKVQYRSIFWQDASVPTVETIFRFQRNVQQNDQDTNLHNAWFSLRPWATGSPFYEVSRALHNKLNPTNSPNANTFATTIPDVRANVIIGPDSTIDPNYEVSADYLNSDKLIINKHGGRQNTSASPWAYTQSNAPNNSFKIMRISEMYMIVAEARAAAGDFVGVGNTLKTVRDARFGGATVPLIATTPQQAWKYILDERRLEFAFEGFRFLDLKRLGMKAGSGIDRHPIDYSSPSTNYPAANPINMPLNSHKWALPIPNMEINVNTMIVQNPGY